MLMLFLNKNLFYPVVLAHVCSQFVKVFPFSFSYFSQLSRAALLLPLRRFSQFGKTPAETAIHSILLQRFPTASKIEVSDLSGSCGTMFQIFVKCKDFRNMPILAQHRNIKEALRKEISSMHGLTILTEE